MASGLPTLVIGVGGTGLRVLQRVKERLLETYYGEVPPQITLLEFDTALQSPADNFCGVQLNEEMIQGSSGNSAIQEMHLIQTSVNYTMDHALKDAREKKDPCWAWMEIDKLDRLLPPSARVILDGAGAFRPIGRTAFFLNYNYVEMKLREAMRQVMTEPIEVNTADLLAGENKADQAKTKRNVFLVGSFAGGTGSGGFLDLAALLRSIKDVDLAFTDIVLIGIIVLPRFFDNIAESVGRRVPNTYAGLRELDRFMCAHKRGTPYTFIGGHKKSVITENTLFDLCYLVDIEDYNGLVNGKPTPRTVDFGALPAITDMIVAHTDLRLGLRLNAANINKTANYAVRIDFSATNGQPYSYRPARHYSALNCHTVIFPREDVAKSLSLRFLLDLIDKQITMQDQRGQLVVPDDPMRIDDLITFLGKDNPPALESQAADLDAARDLGVFVRVMIQYQGKKFDTEPESVMRWLVEDSDKRKKVLEIIRRSLEETTKLPSEQNNMGAYITKVRSWQEKWLGKLIDPNNQFGDRKGGEWDEALGSLVSDQRLQMEAYMQALILRLLNQRQQMKFGEEETSILRANRVGYTLGVLRALKEATRNFIRQAETSFGEASRNLIGLRRDLDDHMGKVKNFSGMIIPGFRPNPGPPYLAKLHEVAEAERQRLLRNLAVTMAQQFGGDIAEEGRNQSVLDTAIKELEGWAKALARVRELIAQERGRHEAQRKEKYAIAVRSYITDTNRFPKASEVEEQLYKRHFPTVWRTLLGPDPMGSSGAGFYWEPLHNTQYYFNYQISTKQKAFKLHPQREPVVASMLGEASGPDAIARVWQAGAFRLLAERIRLDKDARVAAYMPLLYGNQANVHQQVLNPNSRALVQLNGVQPDPGNEEHYLAVDSTSDNAVVSSFYSWFTQTWVGMGVNKNNNFLRAESDVACTFLTLYHGLELDQFKGFADSEPSYRAMEKVQGCLHLFPEERLAAEYEARISALRRSDWAAIKRLQPEVVIGLRDYQRVRSFALAVVSGLITSQTDNYSIEHVFKLPGREPLRLTISEHIDGYSSGGMLPNDKIAARIFQAFQTYTIRGHAIDDPNGFNTIDYAAFDEAFRAWFDQQHGLKKGTQLDQILKQWETSTEGPSLAPLFHAESKDPRFRDLGVVLMLELLGWRELRG